MLLRLVEGYPDLVHPVLIAIDQWVFPPEMAEEIGHGETKKIKMKAMTPQVQCVLKEFSKHTPPVRMVRLSPLATAAVAAD